MDHLWRHCAVIRCGIAARELMESLIVDGPIARAIVARRPRYCMDFGCDFQGFSDALQQIPNKTCWWTRRVSLEPIVSRPMSESKLQDPILSQWWTG